MRRHCAGSNASESDLLASDADCSPPPPRPCRQAENRSSDAARQVSGGEGEMHVIGLVSNEKAIDTPRVEDGVC